MSSGSVEREGSPIRFDLFELDATKGELRRSGLLVDLPPQALRVLAILAECPEKVVTRQEIKEALWPGQSFGDFDGRLNFAIKKLREALADDAEQPRYIQTVRNAGYRFIAPVRGQGTPSSVLPNSLGRPGPNESSAVPEPILGRGIQLGRSGLLLVPATVALVAVATAAVLALRQGSAGQLAEKAPTGSTNVEYQPRIASVTAILPQARQRIVITGRAFGLHVPYVHTDSPYLAIRDLSAHWAAGRIVPHNSDEVMVDVESWTDSEIVMSGFSGDYGMKGWKLAAGDEVEIAVWNPQSGAGPGLFHVRVTAENAAP